MTHQLKTRILFSSLFFLLLLISFPVTSIQAQDSSRVDRMVARLVTRLSLADSQTVQIREVLQSSQDQAAIDREQFQGDRDAMMQAMMDRTKSTDEQIEKLLTDDQKKIYEEVKTEGATQMRERMGRK